MTWYWSCYNTYQHAQGARACHSGTGYSCPVTENNFSIILSLVPTGLVQVMYQHTSTNTVPEPTSPALTTVPLL